MRRILSILVTFSVLVPECALAQPRVTAHVEPDSIMIGDRFTICIEVDQDRMQTVVFPTFHSITAKEGDQAPAVEFIREFPTDTVVVDGRRLKLRKRYEMTAFDEGRYNLGRQQVLYAGKNVVDTLSTEDSLVVSIATFQIDSLNQGICDLKPQKTLKFRFGEISGYLMYALLGLAVLALLVYLFTLYLHSRGKRLTDIFRPAPPLPPHVVALAALDALRAEQLCQKDRHKQYYSAMSEILRTYISGRFGVGAMEMTTDQLMRNIGDVAEISDRNRMDLQTVLSDSDLVKFAKFTPETEQNDGDLQRCYAFVNDTKPVEVVPGDDEDQPLKNDKAEKR